MSTDMLNEEQKRRVSILVETAPANRVEMDLLCAGTVFTPQYRALVCRQRVRLVVDGFRLNVTYNHEQNAATVATGERHWCRHLSLICHENPPNADLLAEVVQLLDFDRLRKIEVSRVNHGVVDVLQLI